MAFPITAAQSIEFAALVNEVAAAPQNQLDATAIERMATWAVASEAYPNRAVFIAECGEAPLRTLLEWASLGFFRLSLSVANLATLDDVVDILSKNHDRPLDATLIERLLPVFEDADFLVNDIFAKESLGTYPYAALMAFAWWLNVSNASIPFTWLRTRASV